MSINTIVYVTHWVSPGQTVLPTQANSNQVTKSKLASAGGQTAVLPSWASLQEWPFNCLTMTAQSPNNNETAWLKLAIMAKGGKIGSNWAKILIWSNSSQLDPTQAKWMAKRYPTWTKLKTWLELAWVGSTIWSGHMTIKLVISNCCMLLPSAVICLLTHLLW